MSKKVYVYGFTKNAFVFLQPALRYILGQNQFNYVGSVEQAWKTLSQADVICVNCGLTFYELGAAFNIIEKLFPQSRPQIICLSWQNVPEENLDLMLEHKIPVIMFDLQSEEEFSLCSKAVTQGKSYRSKHTFNRNAELYCDNMELYSKLSKNQKYAFHYMMIGKSQKEFQLDFGFKSLSTAATHWNMVLQKFDVVNLYELRTKFR